MILFIKNHIIWFPSVQHCNWFGFRISLSLSREGAIFRDEIENYFSCSRLARRDRDYHMTILVFRDENEIPFCYSHVSRRDRDFRKSFLVVEREKMKLTLVENSRDREFSLTSGLKFLKVLNVMKVGMVSKEDLKDVDMLKGIIEYFHRTRVRSLFTLVTN